jgi:hypothetical protein
MAAPSTSPVAIESRELDPAVFRMHGMLAGLLGAALLAGWFLLLDVLRGHPLFTPTLLAHSLVSGSAAAETPESLPGTLGATLVFTVVHALAFAVIGLTVAEFLRRFDLVHSKALALVLLFGALCIAFLAFGGVVAAVGEHGILLRDAFIGNALAAFGMAGYLGWSLGARERV